MNNLVKLKVAVQRNELDSVPKGTGAGGRGDGGESIGASDCSEDEEGLGEHGGEAMNRDGVRDL